LFCLDVLFRFGKEEFVAIVDPNANAWLAEEQYEEGIKEEEEGCERALEAPRVLYRT
jgi:hypothetical protein